MSAALAAGASGASPQRVLVIIAVTAGLAIAGIHELTRPWVAEQRAALLERSLQQVLPTAATFESYGLGTGGSLELHDRLQGAVIFLGRDVEGRAVGVALAASGFGYQDRISLVYGLDPLEGRLLGMRVLESRETPGLGSRIVDDAAFLASFDGLEIPLDQEGRPQPLRIVANARAEAGEIDAITGATVSVRAVARIVSSSLAEWLPPLQQAYTAWQEADDG